MPVDIPVADLVHQLSRVGLRPDERLVHSILAHSDAARPALLSLATDVKALYQEFPRCLGPLHALRLLGEIPDPSMIRPIFACLPIPVDDDDEDEDEAPPNIYSREILQIIGRIGPLALPILWEIVDDTSVSQLSRIAAASAMGYVATYTPEVRDAVIAAARRRLADESQPPDVIQGIVILLSELGDAASYKLIMAIYRAAKIDQELFPAAVARQLLLGGGRQDLTCTNHPLWERYDEHGPLTWPEST